MNNQMTFKNLFEDSDNQHISSRKCFTDTFVVKLYMNIDKSQKKSDNEINGK